MERAGSSSKDRIGSMAAATTSLERHRVNTHRGGRVVRGWQRGVARRREINRPEAVCDGGDLEEAVCDGCDLEAAATSFPDGGGGFSRRWGGSSQRRRRRWLLSGLGRLLGGGGSSSGWRLR